MVGSIVQCNVFKFKTNKFASFQAQQQQPQPQTQQQPDLNNLSRLLGGVSREVGLVANSPTINMHTQLNTIQTTLDRMNTMLQAL